MARLRVIRYRQGAKGRWIGKSDLKGIGLSSHMKIFNFITFITPAVNSFYENNLLFALSGLVSLSTSSPTTT